MTYLDIATWCFRKFVKIDQEGKLRLLVAFSYKTYRRILVVKYFSALLSNLG